MRPRVYTIWNPPQIRQSNQKKQSTSISPQIISTKTVQNGVGTRSEEEAMPAKNGKIRNIIEKRRAEPLDMAQLKAVVLDGTVLSSNSDTGAMSGVGHVGDPLIQTATQSEKKIYSPIRGKTCSSNIAKL